MLNTNWFETNTYDNVPYPIPPNLPGCYAIYKLNYDTREKELLYVGTAENLDRRLSKHEILRVLIPILAFPEMTRVKIKIIANKNMRLQLEKDLIKKLNPIYNKIKYAY